jgi:hypothetical protein
MAAIKFEINSSKKLRFEEGFGWVTKTLCTQKEANAFSPWNNNLGYQGILEYPARHNMITYYTHAIKMKLRQINSLRTDGDYCHQGRDTEIAHKINDCLNIQACIVKLLRSTFWWYH